MAFTLIPFTQYLMPDGRKTQVRFECEDLDVAALATEFIKAEGYFEIEVLPTGKIHMDAWMPSVNVDEPLTLQLCDNGPPVVEAVATLVKDAHRIWKEAQ